LRQILAIAVKDDGAAAGAKAPERREMHLDGLAPEVNMNRKMPQNEALTPR
jgi:hypothetical protein